MAGKKVVGLLVGRENTFPGPFLDMVNQRGADVGVTAELAVFGGTSELEPPRHAVIVDRISHEIPYYRAHLKSAALLGTAVINDPFWWEADEKFFECTLARTRYATPARSWRRSATTWTQSSSRSRTACSTRSTS